MTTANKYDLQLNDNKQFKHQRRPKEEVQEEQM